MGRPSRTRALSVWANGHRVATWIQPPRGEDRLLYDPAWVASPEGRPLSLSLPYTGGPPLTGDRVRHYFDNLLPDAEPIRQRLAGRFRTATASTFDLLAAVGRDCVGAVQLLGENEAPVDVTRLTATPLDEEAIARLVDQATTHTALTDDPGELRISLAGAQEKTALLWHEGRWARPHGSTPTTHILKLPLGLVGHHRADFSTSVENEWLCMNLLAECGLPVARTALLRFGDRRVLGVERFDRRWHPSGAWLMRLPQEDFCQALGLPSHLKYESDGGPGLPDLARVLGAATDPARDLSTLMKSQVMFWLLAAPDGHAKNFSLRLLPQGRHALTPLYDVMSLWPVEGGGPNQVSWHRARLAMAVHGRHRHFRLKDVTRRHFNHTAARWFQRADAEDLIAELLTVLPGAIDRLAARLPPGFPAALADAIFRGVRQSARALAAMPPA